MARRRVLVAVVATAVVLAGCARGEAGRRGSEEVAKPQRVPGHIRFVFTPAQRTAHDQRVAALSKKHFELGVQLAPDEAPIAATAHLRGRGSLEDCARKSYTVKLEGPGRLLFPDVHGDEFILIAMCEDEGYIQLYTAGQLLADFDLYPFRYQYVELAIGSTLAGVYLMVEKPDTALARGASRGSVVLRRRFDGGREWVDVAKPSGALHAAAAWDAFVASLDGLAGRALEDALERRIDLDQFLTWLALMSLLENGDSVDELWLVASDRGAWTFAGWDNDDLFSGCHYGGEFAFEDPHRLSYCADGALEKRILADRVLYRRYVATLEHVISRLTPSAMRAAVHRTGRALLPYFERPDVCAAMVELLADNPAARSPVEARRDIRRHLDRLLHAYTDRRRSLVRRIARYRATTPAP